ncbi:hypothetical protein SLS62_001311 [Diatrype stigma]|uniref:3-phytase n=1 Tax=Diatrype stigma TaxID=117547 RepID=A0AAN9UZP4_9PEZI
MLSLAAVGMIGCWKEASLERFMSGLNFSPPGAVAAAAAVEALPLVANSVSSNESHDDHHSNFDRYKHLGHLSPFFVPPNTPEWLKSGTPPGCTASRAFLIHRHGSRYPHGDELPVIQGLADYIGNNSALFSSPRGPVPRAWSFLQKETGWRNTLTLGVDDLTAPGRQQLFDHGVALRLRYPDLYTEPDDDGAALAVAGDEDRVVESASWFLAGYHGRAIASSASASASASGRGNASTTPPPPFLRVVPEDSDTPSWITPHETCSAWDERLGSDPAARWGAVYLPPIADRLNALLAGPWPGVRFTPAHVHGMFWACAYGTAARGIGVSMDEAESGSPWCDVFEPGEVLDNEYEYDLRQRGFSGYGLPGDMGAVLGGLLVGNVTAFLGQGQGQGQERVFSDEDQDQDRSGKEKLLSLNFCHDKTLAFGLTALGLAADDAFPPEGPVDRHRSWQTARLVPFASYMLWKRLECGEEGGESEGESSGGGSGSSRIQLVLNGANYGLGPTGCAIDEYGTCSFDNFLDTAKVKAALNVTHGDAKWREVCGDA